MIMVDTQQNYSGSNTTNQKEYFEKQIKKKGGGKGDFEINNRMSQQPGTCNLSQQPRGGSGSGGAGGGGGGAGGGGSGPLRVTGGGQRTSRAGLPACTLQVLKTTRNYIADYQEKRGVSRNEVLTFPQLVTTVCQKIYTVVMLIWNMIMNLHPLVDAFLLIFRFILDKAIDCAQAPENERYFKTGILVLESIALFLMILIIFGSIVAPLYVLFGHIISKVWHALYQ